MTVSNEILEEEIKTLQKAASLHAKYSIEQYKKVLLSLKELEREKESLEQKVKDRTEHLEIEILERKKIATKLEEDKKLIEQYNDELHRDKILIEKYLKIVNDNVIITSTDENGVIHSASDAFCEVSGFSIDEVIGRTHNIIQSRVTPDKLYKSLWGTITRGKTWKGEIQNRTKDGKAFWVYITITVQFEEDKIIGFTAIMQDITNKKRIEEISIKDDLTDIYNRRHFNDIFPKTINRAKRSDSLIAFILLDIDFFKQYNDTYGHQMGDHVLVSVSRCIENTLNRADDYCFRLGGEEFGVILSVDEKDKALKFANKIRNNIENLKIEHKNNKASPYITVSMGIYCDKARGVKDEDEVYKLADDLLYEAKDSGRNRVVSNK